MIQPCEGRSFSVESFFFSQKWQKKTNEKQTRRVLQKKLKFPKLLEKTQWTKPKKKQNSTRGGGRGGKERKREEGERKNRRERKNKGRKIRNEPFQSDELRARSRSVRWKHIPNCSMQRQKLDKFRWLSDNKPSEPNKKTKTLEKRGGGRNGERGWKRKRSKRYEMFKHFRLKTEVNRKQMKESRIGQIGMTESIKKKERERERERERGRRKKEGELVKELETQ